MGIYGFYGQFIRKRYKHSIVTEPISGQKRSRKVYGLYLDLNGLLHRVKFVVYGGDGDDLPLDLLKDFERQGIVIDPISKKRAVRASKMSNKDLLETYENVFSAMLLSIINAYSPLVELGLYVDGLVPSAKTQQQRQRREKASKDRAEKLQYNPFDGAQITPGTPFMFWVDEMIQRWIKRNLNNNFVPSKIIYSNHLVPGEGEHKMMQHFRDMYEGYKKEGVGLHNEYSYIVYGLDADLIILSLLQQLEGIYLTRENTTDNINIDDLRISIQEDLGTETAIKDFSVMMSLLGNDFLPSVQGANMTADIDAMYKIYKKKAREIERFQLTTKSGTVDWQGMKEFLKGLTAYEKVARYENLVKEGVKPDSLLGKSVVETNDGRKFSYNRYRRKWYQHVFQSHKNNLIADEYMFDEGNALNDKGKLKSVVLDEIDDMAYDFMKGLEWVLRYYTRGHNNVSQTWFYPYHYPPLFKDMYSYIEDLELSLNVDYEYDGGYTVLHQLLSVLPKSSYYLLPKQLQGVVTGNKRFLKYADMFPDTILVDREGLDKPFKPGRKQAPSWVGIVLTPFVDRLRIQEVIQMVLKDFIYRELIVYVEEEEKIYETKAALKRSKSKIKQKLGGKKEKKVEKKMERKEEKSKHILETFDFAKAKFIM